MPIKILDSSSPTLVDDLLEEIGAKPGDTLRIASSQFERTDGFVVPDFTSIEFSMLIHCTKEQLLSMGMQPWGEYGLWLFPGEWFDRIPDDFLVLSIMGKTSSWSKDTHDKDTRYGALAYGIVPIFELP